MSLEDITQATFRSLEWNRLRTFLAHEAESDTGKQSCLQIEPHDARAVIQQLLEETHESISLLQARSNLSVAGLPPMNEVIARLQTGAALNGKELQAVKVTLSISKSAKASLSLLDRQSFPRLSAFTPRLQCPADLLFAIEGAIDDNGEVKDEASSALRAHRREIHRLDNKIKEELLRIIHSTTLSKALQELIYTQRNGRHVLPVNASMRSQINGIVHDTSATGLTIYVEPMSVVEIANKIRIKEVEIEQEIVRILQELTASAFKHLSAIASSFAALVELDVIAARARLALRYGGHMPELSQDRYFSYQSARHPLLVLQSSVSTVVANDIILGGTPPDSGNTLIITGPNTGGKTVLLKTVGIFALMVRAGLLPSAKPGSIAAIFPIVCADIGDEQSIEQSLSTFSSHMKNIVEIVNNAQDGMLVLLDEVGAGTDPREGAALARAVLETLNHSGAVALTTTHYGELKTLAYTQPGFVNGSLEFDENTLSPTYRLRLGVPGSSQATAIAGRLGLKNEIVARARELMQTREEDLQKVVEQLEHKLQQLDLREREAQEELEQARVLKDEADLQLKQLSHEAQKERSSMSQQMEEEFNLSREYIRHLIADLQKQPNMAKAQRAQADLDKLKKELGWTGNRQSPTKSTHRLQAGQSVRIKSLGQKAVVEDVPGGDDPTQAVSVRVGNVKIKAMLSDLEPIDSPSSQRAARSNQVSRQRQGQSQSSAVAARTPSKGAHPFVRTQSNTLDLRGRRVNDATIDLERFLDESVMSGVPVAMIIHGHGTGAVRQAVREYLNQSEYANAYRPGETFEGGDGVTMVELR